MSSPTSMEGALKRGLTSAQVLESRRLHGANVLTPPARDPWWKLYLEKFDDPVIRILMVAASIAIGVGIFNGHYAEGIGIVIAILLATALAFLNEFKANQEFAILNQVNDEVQVKVVRDGNVTTVPRRDVVKGDIALVELGEEMPADGNVLEAVGLQVDESALTGESGGVTKHAQGTVPATPGKELAYPADQVCRGTMVVDGHGTVEITGVGDATEIGRTAREATEETEEVTPLNAQLEKLSKLIGVVGTGMAALTMFSLIARGVIKQELVLSPGQWLFAAALALGVAIAIARVWLPIVYDGLELAGREASPPAWLEREGIGEWLKALGLGLAMVVLGTVAGRVSGLLPSDPTQWLPVDVGQELLTYFMIAVTIVVVAVPEGLAMAVTLSLAYSMRKMTATNNLVRRMHACETIGAATVICSDKTGTLTLNEMRVAEMSLPWQDGRPLASALQTEAGRLFAEGIAANTTAHLNRAEKGAPKPIGNPTEGALLLWLEANAVDYVGCRAAFPVTYQWTFSTDRKYMATFGASTVRSGRVLHVKGAPEIVLGRCTHVLTASGPSPVEGRRAEIEAALKAFQARGMRTLGFAFHGGVANHDGVEIEELASGLTWLGFAAIADPVRPEVPDAIKACRGAGIDVKIVTGDNPETAAEIARQIGLVDGRGQAGEQRLGKDFAPLSDEQAAEVVPTLKVLARARPTDKMKLVRVLQQQRGEVVAVTGDGTNDAPALNYANVGLAMGKAGTAVAKEASDIVLLDDSFKSIVNAVMWGRSLYENIQRFILFQLTINVVALGVAFLGPFIGVKLPLTVTQMLWINLIMDTFAALALATEPPHEDVMRRKPRRPDAFIVTPPMGRAIFGIGALFLVIVTGYLIYLQRDGSVDNRELTLFFAVFVMLQFWNLFNARALGRKQSALSGVFENKGFLIIAAAIFVGQILIVQLGGTVFRTEPLSVREWITIVLATSPVLLLGELWRWWGRGAETA